MATLSDYTSAVAAAAQGVAGVARQAAENVAVAPRQGGEYGEAGLTADLRRALRMTAPVEIPADARKAGGQATQEAQPPAQVPAGRGSIPRRETAGIEARPAREQDATGARLAERPDTGAHGSRAPEEPGPDLRHPRRGGEAPAAQAGPAPAAQPPEEGLLGPVRGRGTGGGAVEVVLHAADDLSAAIAESDEVRETILRTVAEVMMDR
jgi:hypothetical protein